MRNKGYIKQIMVAGILCVLSVLFIYRSVCAKQKIRLDNSSMVMSVGESRKLKLDGISSKYQNSVSWKSSDKGIISVSRTGKVKARKAGRAVVTAGFKGKKYKCSVLAVSRANADYGEEAVTPGTNYYKGFQTDNVFHSKKNGDIHYNVYFPDSYGGRESHALFITLPGYQGLYFQGAAENIRTEDFGFEARRYDPGMVVLAPQLEDWGKTSAGQTIALTEYFLSHYKIDPSKVYINGYSAGGETLSIVLGKRPELFAAAVMCSSQWDGAYGPLARAGTPVYFVTGRDDEYYGSKPFRNAYKKLHSLYLEQGLSEDEISRLLVLDIKDSPYFSRAGIEYQHEGGLSFCYDEEIMGWLFRR